MDPLEVGRYHGKFRKRSKAGKTPQAFEELLLGNRSDTLDLLMLILEAPAVSGFVDLETTNMGLTPLLSLSEMTQEGRTASTPRARAMRTQRARPARTTSPLGQPTTKRVGAS